MADRLIGEVTERQKQKGEKYRVQKTEKLTDIIINLMIFLCSCACALTKARMRENFLLTNQICTATPHRKKVVYIYIYICKCIPLTVNTSKRNIITTNKWTSSKIFIKHLLLGVKLS